MQLHGGRVEAAAVVAQQGGAAEFGGDGCGLVGEFAHALLVAAAREGVGGGLDEQAALGGVGRSAAAQVRVVGGGQRDGQGLRVPAGLAGQDRQVPGGLGSDERMTARFGGDPGPGRRSSTRAAGRRV